MIIIKRMLLWLPIILLSSCFAIQPELINAESLDKGKHKTALGVYGGFNELNTSLGLSGAHSFGCSHQLNWTTNAEVVGNGRSVNSILKGYGNTQVHFSTGPKIGLLRDRLALRLPLTFSLIEGDRFLSASPTLLFNTFQKKGLIYFRYNYLAHSNEIYNYLGDLTAGYTHRMNLYDTNLLLSLLTNGLGIYCGIGIAL